jgi:hypothetical protein
MAVWTVRWLEISTQVLLLEQSYMALQLQNMQAVVSLQQEASQSDILQHKTILSQ